MLDRTAGRTEMAPQALEKAQSVRGNGYSRKSSLIPVLARVWASTVFTITAQ